MTAPTPVGFLDFFILEASEYVDQLDALLLAGRSSASGPDADSLQRAARALRGSATMAKFTPFADVAAGLERVGRALRERTLPWDVALGAALVAAVDDCKIFLRNARAWSAADDERASVRLAELSAYAGSRISASAAARGTAGHDSYLVSETANIGAGMELLATRPSDRDASSNVLRRIRALRGLASIRDRAVLGDVLEGAEVVVRSLEAPGAGATPERTRVLTIAAALLRSISSAIQDSRGDPQGDAIREFDVALAAAVEHDHGAPAIVPIASLFYSDGGETVVKTAPNPPTTSEQRFRLEAAGQGEHLRRLIGDAKSAHVDARDRAVAKLRTGLLLFSATATSFGEHDVVARIATSFDRAMALDREALESLDAVAASFVQAPAPTSGPTHEADSIPRPRMSIATPSSLPTVAHPTPVAASIVAPPTLTDQARERPAAAAVATAATAATGTSKLADLLDRGIERLGQLGTIPLSAPVTLDEHPPVPIEVLLYRGRAAIERCRQIRDEAREAGHPLGGDTLHELYDLLDLALVE